MAWLGPKVEELLVNKPKPPPLAPGPYVVANKRGGMVRAGVELTTPPVGDLLPAGTRVTVAESVHVANGRPRARISAPVEGWLSCHVVAKEVV